jgi:hypothetical protein
MARSSADIKIDLDDAVDARRKAMLGQEYSIDTGQGRQSVRRADLNQLNATVNMLQAEYDAALDDEQNGGGIISLSYERRL